MTTEEYNQLKKTILEECWKRIEDPNNCDPLAVSVIELLDYSRLKRPYESVAKKKCDRCHRRPLRLFGYNFITRDSYVTIECEKCGKRAEGKNEAEATRLWNCLQHEEE